MSDKPKIHFGLIDARDDEVVGIDRGYCRGQTEHNCRLLLQAELEYLLGLEKLQQEIKQKYEALLENEDEDETEDGVYEDEDSIHDEVYQEKEVYDRLNELYYT